MAEKFTAEVLTPEGEVFSDEVEMVSTRTTVGSIGILAKHQPLLGMLDPTELRLYATKDGDYTAFAQGEGYVQVTGDHVLILCEEAVKPEDLDTTELQERISRAEEELSSAEDGSEQQRVAQRDKRRAEAFLAIAGGGSGPAH
jgi:F-type H+-transporting ATPase subunit epsilon